MSNHLLPYLANCSLLFTEEPLLRRPAAARAAGFGAVEFWWPFVVPVPSDREVDAFTTAIEEAGVALAGLVLVVLAAGGWRVMAIFSGRTAAQTGAPGSASTLPAVRRRPAGVPSMLEPSSPRRPSNRLTSPMKSATQREFGCS